MPGQAIVIFCSSSSKGGLELNLFKLGTWLSEAGERVVFCFRAGTPLFNMAQSGGYELIAIEEPAKYFDLLRIRQYLKLITKLKPKGLIVSLNRDIDALSWAKRFSSNSFKYIYLQQMLLPTSKRGLIHRLRYEMLDYWVSPLPSLKEQVLKNAAINAEKVVEIPLAIDTAPFVNTKARKLEGLEFLNLSSEKSYLGIIGRIDPIKGQHTLVKAFAKVAADFPDWSLLIVGEPSLHSDGSFLTELKTLVREFGIEDRVEFRNFINDPALFYAAIDVFVLASEAEPIGMVTVEAMASSIPMVVTQAGGTIDLVDNGKFAQFFQTGDVAGLAAQLTKALRNLPERSAIAENAQTRCIQLYDKRVQVQGFLQLLQF